MALETVSKSEFPERSLARTLYGRFPRRAEARFRPFLFGADSADPSPRSNSFYYPASSQARTETGWSYLFSAATHCSYTAAVARPIPSQFQPAARLRLWRPIPGNLYVIKLPPSPNCAGRLHLLECILSAVDQRTGTSHASKVSPPGRRSVETRVNAAQLRTNAFGSPVPNNQ